MFHKKFGDLIVSAFYTVLSIVIIVLATQLPKSKVMSIGPDFMPLVVGIISLILALILLVQSIGKLRSKEDAAEAEERITAITAACWKACCWPRFT